MKNSKIKSRLDKLASKIITDYNAEMQKRDLELFNADYTSQPKIDIEDLNADIDEMGLDAGFALNPQPLTYVITVHIRNLRASNQDDSIITRHVSNLELTYGPETVESVIKSVFPTFHKQYYGGN